MARTVKKFFSSCSTWSLARCLFVDEHRSKGRGYPLPERDHLP